jgi:hypothetical protein
MGERKRKLSTAVLSDDRSNKNSNRELSTDGSDRKQNSKSKQKKDEDDDNDDIGAIGRILQRALQRANIIAK